MEEGRRGEIIAAECGGDVVFPADELLSGPRTVLGRGQASTDRRHQLIEQTERANSALTVLAPRSN